MMYENLGMQKSMLDIIWERGMTSLSLIDTDNKFIKINPMFTKLIGYSEPEMENKSIRDIVHPEDLEYLLTMLLRIRDNDISDTFIMSPRIITKLGKVIWVLMKVNAVFDKEGLHSYSIIHMLELEEVREQINNNNTNNLPNKTNKELWKFIKDNSGWLIIIGSSIAYIIAKVLEFIDGK